MALRKLNKFQNLMRKIENRFFSKNLVQDEVKTDFRLYFSSKAWIRYIGPQKVHRTSCRKSQCFEKIFH
jgi:hypothetical protein